MPKYKILISPNYILNEEEYEIEADKERVLRGYDYE